MWRSPANLARKLEASFHLTGYGIHLLMCTLSLIYPFVLYFSRQFPSLLTVFGIGTLFNLSAVAPKAYFLLAQREIGGRWWQRLPPILFLTVLGAGMVLHTVRAAAQILARHTGAFERTPKFGIAGRGLSWSGRRYQLPVDPLVSLQLLMAIWNSGTLLYALRLHNWVIAFYAAIFSNRPAVHLRHDAGPGHQGVVAWRRQRAHALRTFPGGVGEWTREAPRALQVC